MSLQGKSEEELQDLREKLIEEVKRLGGSAGNIRLIRNLGWDEDDYWSIRNRLVDLGLLRPYRARGGAVEIPQPPESVPTSAQVASAPEMQECEPAGVEKESDLYGPVSEVLKSKWVRDLRFRHSLVEITASQGRRSTGGVWTRPDVVIAALRVFPYLPGKYFDLITFEIKPSWAINVTAVYEALAHRRAATQSYVLLHCIKPEENTELLERIREEAERHGIGMIVASDVKDYETWNTMSEPKRVDPDPELLNEFVALQLTSGSRDELAAWVR